MQPNREVVQHLELLLKEARKGMITEIVSVFASADREGNVISIGSDCWLQDCSNDGVTVILVGLLEKKKAQLLNLLICDDC